MKAFLLLFFSIYGVTCFTDQITKKQPGSAGADVGEMLMQRLTLPVYTVSSLFWTSGSRTLLYTAQTDAKYLTWAYSTGQVTETEIADFKGKQFMFLIPVEGQSQVYLAAVDGTLVLVTVQPGSTPQSSKPVFAVNDTSSITRGHCDSQGRLFFGTCMCGGQGKLYKMENGVTQVMATFPESVDDCSWSVDYRALYCVTSGGAVIVKYTYDLATGTIDTGTDIFNVMDFSQFGSQITGIDVGVDGYLWITLIPAGVLLNLDPDSRTILQAAKLQTIAPTCIKFGGYNQKNLIVGSMETGVQYDYGQGSVYLVSGIFTSGLGSNAVVMPVS